ncbi:MAG: HAMP domain-containing protein [Caldithrix sp.]|nr:HAMP domain-containing protein [Caldithrix sp.]
MPQIIEQLRKMTIKFKIIIVFSFIVIVLVGLTTYISYNFVKNLYVEQLNDQVELLVEMAGQEIDTKYLSFIEGEEKNLAYRHYRKKLSNITQRMELSNAFLFNRKYEIIASVKSDISTPKLKINRSEIANTSINQISMSLPFKGHDGQWYLWAFHRLAPNYYLGIQENVNRLAKLDYLAYLFLFIAIVAILITFLAGWILARSIAQPINRLVQFSQTTGSGQFRIPPPKGIYGELNILSNALVKMRDNLAEHQKERERILAQIAHEIRNPLGGIELMVGLIKEDVKKDSKHAEYLNKINSEIQGLKQQITAYLHYSRPVQANPEKIDLEDMCTELRTIFAKQLEKKNINLICNNQYQNIVFDRQHLKQVLMNLIQNSFDNMNGSGNMIIESFKNGSAIGLTISDQGPGISEDHIPYLFNPFFTTRKNGTGLGLAISQRLCQENQANLTVKNNASKGCTFTIIKSTDIV